MPRSIKEILDHADELSKRFEDYEPDPRKERDPKVYELLRAAVLARSAAEEDIYNAVLEARATGYSWSLIGSLLGTTGEAARQRYGKASA